MTKTLGQIQKENRKFILEAIHGCSYEEALQKEWGENCIITDCEVNGEHMVTYGRVIKDNRHKSLYANIDSGNQLEFSVNWDDDFKCTIIGKPITLSRVLLAFKNKEVKSIYKDEIIFNIECSKFCGLKLEEAYYNPHYSLYGAGNWNLEIEELEEQSEETQRVINQLLTGE